MKPASLEQALEFAQEELNVLYLQNRNKPQASRQFQPAQFSHPMQKAPGFSPPPPASYRMQNQPSQGSWPAQFPVNNARPFYPAGHRPQFNGPSRTQQMMRALPRSNMSTGFKIPPRHPPQQNYPQPMSGVSHAVARTLPPQRQLHVNETFPECDYYEHPDLTSDDQHAYYDYENANQEIDMTHQCPISDPAEGEQNFCPSPSSNAPT